MPISSAAALAPDREQAGGIRPELLGASDAQIEDAVCYSDPMSLRGLIYQLTGDEELAAVETVKNRVFLAEAWNVATEEGVALIRRKAADFLKAYRDAGAGPIGPGPIERLPRSLHLAAGDPIPADELGMWIEETAIDPWARGLNWPEQPTPEQLAGFSVIVVGAGMGGLNAAVQLKHAGIDYMVLEKNPEVGGTWFENRYPGARVDTPSRAYTHIFGADFVFDHPFSPQEDNERYFNWVADHFGVRGDVRFDTEVSSMRWDEGAKLWRIVARDPQGEKHYSANAVICASGLLARPNLPDLPGMADFTGPSFHTARWPADLDVSGKRVAVIGTGATGYQMVPELAKVAKQVVLFQRKPQWLFPVPGYLSALPDQVTWLDRNLPYHINFLRFRTNWLTGEHVYGDVFTLDPAWMHDHSRSPQNHEIREGRIAYIREKFAGRPDLIEKMIPPHPPFSARPILVDSEYNIYDALLRDDVELVSAGVEAITEDGVVAGGETYPVDVIVYATGFKANDLLWPMEIVGRDGLSVEQFWAKDGCRAHIAGSMMPGFPNFFILFGPNTNPAHGGGIVNHEEMVTRFAMEAMAHMILGGDRVVDVRRDAFDRYNAYLDEREATKIYTDSRARNFFMNKYARSSVMCPLGPSEMWRMFRDDGPRDIVFSR
ncbi:FAD-dependent oxidoreductase [Sphingomonas sp. YL-JM2C]